MPVKLLFITSQYFYQPTVDALARLNVPCETKVVPYNDFEHIGRLYGQYAEQYDACFTSGVIAKQAIELAYPNPKKPLVPFQISPDALHRDILRVILDTQSMDLSRIAMDFLITIGDSYSVADFLKMEDIYSVYDDNAQMTRSIGTRNGYTIEDVVLKKITTLWENNALDLVICQYSSIIPMLQERGIPYRCSFVSDQQLNSIIQDVLVKIELQKLHENHPVIIQIFSRQSGAFTGEQYHLLRQQVQEFIRANLMECVMQDANGCCVLITSVKILRFLTNEFQICQLSAYLNEHLSFPVLVAYGVGTTVPHAMNNVQIASKEATIVGNPFIVDSKGCLIGPLNSTQHMVLSTNAMPNVSDIARRCSLSAMTIQKIITILHNMGSDKITTQELALRLDTTIRNANRIMLNLCKGGAAVPVYTQATHSRGRPVQVYALDFDTSGK